MRISLLPALASAFALGIAISGTWLLPVGPAAAASVAALAGGLAAARAGSRWLMPLLCLLAVAVGAFCEAEDRARHPDVLAPWVGRRVEIEGYVLDEPRLTASGRWQHRVLVDTLRWRAPAPDGRWRRCSSRLEARILLHTPLGTAFSVGERVRAAGFLYELEGYANFGGFDYARYMARDHFYQRLRAEAPFIRKVGEARLRPDRRLALAIRTRMIRVHRRALPPLDAALLNSLVFGSRATPVPDDTERDFRRSGLTHLLVASGTQVTYLSVLVLLLLRRALLPHWLATLAVAAVSWLYGVAAGGGPSVVRAGVMGTVVALLRPLGREPDLLPVLALAALALLGLDPPVLFDVGFQLTFAAVWGLIVLRPWIRAVLPRRPGWLWQGIAMTAAAQAATTPITAYHFCQVAPAGLLANLLAVPLAVLLLVTGFGVSLAGIAVPAAAVPLDTAVLPLTVALRGWAGACARIPGGFFWVVPPSPLGVALAFATLAALPSLQRQHLEVCLGDRRMRAGAVCCLIALLGWRLASRPSRLRVTFLDVGQGDSILVQAPDGRALLMDGGGVSDAPYDFGDRVLLPVVLRRGARRLDWVVLSHPQADHAGGLEAVCRELPVGALVDPGLPTSSPEATRAFEWARRHGVPRQRARAGASWMLGDRTRMSLLHPPDSPLASGGDETNDNCVVVRVDFGGASFLLPGDVEAGAEEFLVAGGSPLRAAVLKVPHHGSRTSSGLAFVKAVSPQVAVVSVGRRNPFGHPAPEVVARLEAQSALVFRTDRDGAVEVTTDGRCLWLRTARQQGGRAHRVPLE